MNYKVYKKVINDILSQNERNKTMQNKIKVLRELDNGNKELKRMISFLTNELVDTMVRVLEIGNEDDYSILLNNYHKLNIPVKVIDEIKYNERNVVRELCMSEEDIMILSKNKLDDKLKIVATIIYNYNCLIELLQIDDNIKNNLNKLLSIKDLTLLEKDESFIEHYSKDILKKMIKSNDVFTNEEIIYLFNEYPNIFNYIDEDFELLSHNIASQKSDNIDKLDLNKIIGSMTYKLKI